MTEGLSAVLSRVSQIESLISPTAPASTAGTGSSATAGTDFADALGQAGTGAGSTGSSALGAQAVAIATQYLGTPYRWGGTDPKTGLDCSGFTQLVYGRLGIDLPRTSGAQAGTGTAVGSLADAQPGDLLFFGSPVHHVGIYVGDGKMIDAPHAGDKVKIQSVYETPSQIRRVVPATAPVTDSGLASVLAGLTGSSGSTSTALAGLPSGSTSGALGGTPYAALFQAAGQRYGLDPALLSAVARTESGYNPTAVSSAGAEGLMQIMPGTARSLGVNPLDPAQAVDGAARLLSDNLRSFGRVDLALAAYNAGAGAVRKYNGVPPYPETQNYVQRVQTTWGQLR
jgi:hypothetical protein